MRRRVVTGCLLLPLALPVPARAQAEASDGAINAPSRLKLSPVLEPPPLKGARTASPLPSQTTIFLRADSIQGNSEQWLEAAGKVELRGRRDTVLADWLRYDVEADEFWGKGNVVL